MKRALFKLGKHFIVDSISHDSRFVLDVNVDEWKNSDQWQFSFNSFEDDTAQQLDQIGTTISVTDLLPAVANAFGLDNFRTRLANDIRAAHQQSITAGLMLSLNGLALTATTIRFRQSSDIQTAYKHLTFGDASSTVTVRLYTGIADSQPTDAGWYVFCNGRLLLEADQTS